MTAFDAWALPDGWPDPEDLDSVVIQPAGVRATFPVWDSGDLRKLSGLLREGRSAGLAHRPVAELVDAVGAVGSRFLREGDELRREALSLLPAYSGLSPAMAREVLNGMARDWTSDRLRQLLRIELGDPTVLDRFRPDPGIGSGTGSGHASAGSAESRWVRAIGPELSLHVCASTVPGVSVTSLIRGLLVKAAVVLKPGRSDLVLPVLFARGLREEAPELAECVAVSYWPGGTGNVEAGLLAESDAVVVYGSDSTVRALRDRTPVTATFVAYRHRVGAVLVGREGLHESPEVAGRLREGDEARTGYRAEASGDIAERVARAIAVFDQRGCVSPHVVYVEGGGGMEPGSWAAELAHALAGLENTLPSAPLLPSEASTIQQLRGTWEMRAAAEEAVSAHHGGSDAPWSVFVEPDPGFEASCTGRVVRIRPVESLETAVEELSAVGAHLQTVSLEGLGEARRLDLAESLARAGAVRITTAEESPWPPPWWHHDGEGPLEPLLRWTDLEGFLPVRP